MISGEDLLFVNGTLMQGLALHGNLAGAEFVGAVRTAPRYRIHSINDVHPGMYEVESGCVSVDGELYRVPEDVWRRVEAGEPKHLYRGPVHLEDGRIVPASSTRTTTSRRPIATSPRTAGGAGTPRSGTIQPDRRVKASTRRNNSSSSPGWASRPPTGRSSTSTPGTAAVTTPAAVAPRMPRTGSTPVEWSLQA
jgi:gamma-glutamylcyclotransferase (GGCT)/AIG2-like uncharacterized protein YtfP